MNKDDLKSIIKQIIKEQLLGEEQLEEISSTGAASGYQTPNAFSGKDAGWKGAEFGEDSMPNPNERKSNAVDEEHPDKLDEARGRYYNFKESAKYKKPQSKISYVVSEIKKMLKEVNYLVDVSSRLKNESGVESSSMWKRSRKDLQQIESFTRAITQKLKGLK